MFGRLGCFESEVRGRMRSRKDGLSQAVVKGLKQRGIKESW